MWFGWILIALVGCVDEVGKDMENAVVDAPAVAADAPKDAMANGEGTMWYGTDAVSIEALGAKVTATHPINFARMTAQASTNAEGQLSSIEFNIDMSDFSSDHPKLTEHLHNEDFFHTGMFPTASFKSTSVAAMPADEDGNNAKVQGDLTIRGVTKTIEAKAKAAVEGDMMRATSKFKINRQDFKITYKGRADNLVQDNVVVTVNFEGSSTKPAADAGAAEDAAPADAAEGSEGDAPAEKATTDEAAAPAAADAAEAKAE